MTPTEQEYARLLRRVRSALAIFFLGLFLSGVTAFPLQTELAAILRLTTGHAYLPAAVVHWLQRVYDALGDENARYPFLAYGTDWLAFAHLVLAVLFIGPWRDPVRNQWVIQFGFIACAGVPLLAFIAGPIRGIPLYWRLIDTSFGVIGALVLWPVWRAIQRLEALKQRATQS